MNTALRARDGVDFINDDRPNTREECPSAFRCEEDVERFRRGDQDVRRDAQHSRARGRLGVAAPYGNANLGKRLARLLESPRELRQWQLEVPVDVVAERFEGRDVEDLHRVGERRPLALGDQLVELPQECGKRLPRAGRRQDEGVRPLGDGRPSALLRRTRRAQCLREPPADDRVEALQGGHRHRREQCIGCHTPRGYVTLRE